MHALLDLADGKLRQADLDAAAELLQRYRAEHGPHMFAWRTAWRAKLLAARLHLAADGADEAIAGAAEVVGVAREQSQERYQTLARLVLAECAHRRSEQIDLDAVDTDVQALRTVAPLEAWWLTAVTATFGVDRWGTLAQQRAASLATEAGEHADTLRRAAGHLLFPTRR